MTREVETWTSKVYEARVRAIDWLPTVLALLFVLVLVAPSAPEAGE
jgi:hypothetical protein